MQAPLKVRVSKRCPAPQSCFTEVFLSPFTPALSPKESQVHSPAENGCEAGHLQSLGRAQTLLQIQTTEGGRDSQKYVGANTLPTAKKTKMFSGEIHLKPFSHSTCLARRDRSWGIGPLGGGGAPALTVYSVYSGRARLGVLIARESGALKASFSSGYGGT